MYKPSKLNNVTPLSFCAANYSNSKRLVRCCGSSACSLQMLREMQDEQRAMNNSPAEMQAQAHASAVKRFTGGGFAVN